ncbi:hypothetical protein CRG98_034626 [Punica granatum]|uniref:MATH domain-containing protein n=1 Tax=Punica granatum TaxID=22663 RepID=A0A2I0ILW1_PUNGR|nr:hypothetical protein CRG98_034626 [Punica granatum]
MPRSLLLTWSVADTLCDRRSRPYLAAHVKGTPWRIGLLKSNVSCSGARRYMLSVVGLCSGEGPICLEVSLNLNRDARVYVE